MTDHQENRVGKSKMCDPDEAMDKILRRIRSSQNFPAISKYLVELNQKLSDQSVYVTAAELANIIIKDYALTNKLLKMVNSAVYGVMAGRVSTVSRAVILLGYEYVRLAASTLVVFEHFQKKSAAADMKEALVHSFWCGVMAKEMAVCNKYANSEEAFICAMLHDLGRLLTILHMPREYKAIKLKIAQDDLIENKAVMAILGVSFASLGKQVARSWEFPEKILISMDPLSPAALKSGDGAVDVLHALAVFVNRLGRGLVTGTPDRVSAVFSDLCQQYKGLLQVDKPHLDCMIQGSLANVRKHAEALQLSIEKSLFMSCLENYCQSVACSGKERTAPLSGKAQPSANAFHLLDINVDQPAMLSDQRAPDPIAVLMDGLQEVVAAMAVDPDVNNVALMCLEIIYRALKFNQVILFINDTARQVMEARYGYGRDHDSIARKVRFRIQPQEQEIFSLAINLHQDLIVEDAEGDQVCQMIPQWYYNHFNAPAFLFFPIMYKKVCLGAIYADRKQKGLPISELEHRYVGMLRNQMILALKYSKEK